MKGTQYVVDDDGHRTAVVINLEQYGDLREDLYDSMTTAPRYPDPAYGKDRAPQEVRPERWAGPRAGASVVLRRTPFQLPPHNLLLAQSTRH